MCPVYCKKLYENVNTLPVLIESSIRSWAAREARLHFVYLRSQIIVGGGSTAASGSLARQPGGQQFQVRPLRLPDRPQRCCATTLTADRCEHERVC